MSSTMKMEAVDLATDPYTQLKSKQRELEFLEIQVAFKLASHPTLSIRKNILKKSIEA